MLSAMAADVLFAVGVKTLASAGSITHVDRDDLDGWNAMEEPAPRNYTLNASSQAASQGQSALASSSASVGVGSLLAQGSATASFLATAMAGLDGHTFVAAEMGGAYQIALQVSGGNFCTFPQALAGVVPASGYAGGPGPEPDPNQWILVDLPTVTTPPRLAYWVERFNAGTPHFGGGTLDYACSVTADAQYTPAPPGDIVAVSAERLRGSPDRIIFNYRIEDNPVPPFRLGLYGSDDVHFDDQDQRVDTFTTDFGPISVSGATWVAAPQLREVGEHTIELSISGVDGFQSSYPFYLVVADDLGQVPETRDDNNVAAVGIKMQSAQVVSPDAVDVTVVTAGIGQFDLGLFVSPHDHFDSTAVEVDQQPGIQALGGEQTVRIPVAPGTIPGVPSDMGSSIILPRATPFLLAVADPQFETGQPNTNVARLGFQPDQPAVDFVAPVHADHYAPGPVDGDGNPVARPVNQVVMHAMAGSNSGTLRWFQTSIADRQEQMPPTETARASSAHYLVAQNGTITQMVPERDVSHHAAGSVGQTNLRSIGIELEDNQLHDVRPDWASDALLARAAYLVRTIADDHEIHEGGTKFHLVTESPEGAFEKLVGIASGNPDGIAPDETGIIGHGQVVNRTAGKTDPQLFDWPRFMNRVNSGIVHQLHGPSNLLVVDPAGRRAGFDPDSGGMFLEIPGAQYSGPGTEPQFLAVPSAMDGFYTVQVIGTDEGHFTLEVFAADERADLANRQVEGTTAAGQVSTYVVHYSADDANDLVLTEHASPLITGLTLSATDIVADAILVLSGQFAAPGALDEHTVLVDWGDGTVGEFPVPAGQREFSIEQRYQGLPDQSVMHRITVRVMDPMGGASPDLQALLNPAPEPYGLFGFPLAALDDSRVFISAVNANQQGEVYLFDAGGGKLLETIRHPDPDEHDHPYFGVTVAVVGADTVVVGGDESRAYVFSIATGELVATLSLPEPEPLETEIQHMAALGSDRVIVAAEHLDPETDEAEVALVYVFDVTTGALLRTLADPDSDGGSRFGAQVAPVGTDRILVAAPQGEIDEHALLEGDLFVSAQGPGKVYLFDADTGAVLRTFQSPSLETGDLFGASIAVVGTSHVLIGAPGDSTLNDHAGAAFLFDLQGNLVRTFTNPSRVTGSELQEAAHDLFGFAIAVSPGGRILIGAPGESVDGVPGGAAYLFHLDDELWSRVAGPRWQELSLFGSALAALGEAFLVGAPGDDFGARAAGAAYLFGRELSVRVHPPGQGPTLDKLSVLPDRVWPAGELTLSVEGAFSASGAVAQVAFYRDANENGMVDDDDQLLGVVDSGTDGWSLPVSNFDWAVGQHTLLARAQDGAGLWSEPASATVVVSWHGGPEPLDVNNDGLVTPFDALLLIQYLNTHPAGPVPSTPPPPGLQPAFYDVNDDGMITPFDALLVIDHLNRSEQGEGEPAGEGEGLLPRPGLFSSLTPAGDSRPGARDDAFERGGFLRPAPRLGTALLPWIAPGLQHSQPSAPASVDRWAVSDVASVLLPDELLDDIVPDVLRGYEFNQVRGPGQGLR